MNTLDFVMAFEAGQLSDEKIIEGFQELVDTGLAWSLIPDTGGPETCSRISVGDALAYAVYDLEEQAQRRRHSPVSELDLSGVLRAAQAWVCAMIERAEVEAPAPSTPPPRCQHKEQG